MNNEKVLRKKFIIQTIKHDRNNLKIEEILCVANRKICLLGCNKTRFIIQESCKKGPQEQRLVFVS